MISDIWSLRKFVFWTTVAAFLASLVFLAIARLSVPTVQTSAKAVSFTFSGADRGQYPNEEPFSLDDVLALVVLERTIEQNQLEKFDLDIDKLSSMLSIRPYAPISDAIAERYKDRLSDRKLSYSERKEIETEFQQEMKSNQGRNARLSLVQIDRIPIQTSLATKILDDIVKNWADVQISEYGILQLLDQPADLPLIEKQDSLALDPPQSALRMKEAAQKLLSEIQELRAVGPSSYVKDAETGMTIEALERRVSEFHRNDLDQLYFDTVINSSNRSLERLAILLNKQIENLNVKAKQHELKAESLQSRLAEYSKSSTVDTAPAGTDSTGLPRQGGGTTISQFGDNSFRQIIDLARQEKDFEFRQKLISDQIKEKEAQINIEARVNLIKTDLATISNQLASPYSPQPIPDTTIKDRISSAIDDLNSYWDVLKRLHAKLNDKTLSFNGNLYKEIEIEDDLSETTSHPVFNYQVMALLAALTFIVAILSLLIALVAKVAARSRMAP